MNTASVDVDLIPTHVEKMRDFSDQEASHFVLIVERGCTRISKIYAHFYLRDELFL